MIRTDQQRKALEVYCRMVADEMNASGYDFKQVISLPVSMTQDLVKEYIFKVIMRAMFSDKESTTQLSTTEIQAVYETMNNALAEKFGISIPWPDLYTLELDRKLRERGMRE